MSSPNDFKVSYDLWDSSDKRLPSLVEREPPSKAFCDSIKDIQLDPIGVGYNKKEGWFLIYGRKRLLACRHNKQKVKVQIFEGATKNDIAVLSHYENNHRSRNEVTDYLSIRDLLKKPGNNYDIVANMLYISMATVKATEKKFHKVPDWVFPGIFDGSISISTAKKIGNAKASIQKKLEKLYAKEKRITFNEVAETTKVTFAELMPTLIKEPPKVFSISSLNHLEELIQQEKYDEALKYIKEIKKG